MIDLNNNKNKPFISNFSMVLEIIHVNIFFKIMTKHLIFFVNHKIILDFPSLLIRPKKFFQLFFSFDLTSLLVIITFLSLFSYIKKLDFLFMLLSISNSVLIDINYFKIRAIIISLIEYGGKILFVCLSAP